MHGNREKLAAVALVKTFLKRHLFSAEGLSHITIEFNILGRDRVCGDEETKREKYAQETNGY